MPETDFIKLIVDFFKNDEEGAYNIIKKLRPDQAIKAIDHFITQRKQEIPPSLKPHEKEAYLKIRDVQIKVLEGYKYQLEIFNRQGLDKLSSFFGETKIDNLTDAVNHYIYRVKPIYGDDLRKKGALEEYTREIFNIYKQDLPSDQKSRQANAVTLRYFGDSLLFIEELRYAVYPQSEAPLSTIFKLYPSDSHNFIEAVFQAGCNRDRLVIGLASINSPFFSVNELGQYYYALFNHFKQTLDLTLSSDFDRLTATAYLHTLQLRMDVVARNIYYYQNRNDKGGKISNLPPSYTDGFDIFREANHIRDGLPYSNYITHYLEKNTNISQEAIDQALYKIQEVCKDKDFKTVTTIFPHAQFPANLFPNCTDVLEDFSSDPSFRFTLQAPAQGWVLVEQLLYQGASEAELMMVMHQAVKDSGLDDGSITELQNYIIELQNQHKSSHEILRTIIFMTETIKNKQNSSFSYPSDIQIGGLITQTTKSFAINPSGLGFTTGSRDGSDLRFFTWQSEPYNPFRKPPYVIDLRPFRVDQKLGMNTIFPGLQFDEQVSKQRGAFVRIPGATDYQPDLAVLFEPNARPLEITQPSHSNDIIFNPDEQLIIFPRRCANPVTASQSQGQVARIIQFPSLQQQKMSILPKAAGAESLRFVPSFNNSIVELRPRGSVATDLSSRMGTSYTIPITGSERAGRIIVLPSKGARVPITQTPFAKGVGYYMMARVSFSAAHEIGKANSGKQSWDKTNKNLTRIGEGVAVGLVIACFLPKIALTWGCCVIAKDAYSLANPRKPRLRVYKISPPPLDPGGLIALGGPLGNKLKKPVVVEILNHITYSSATPIVRIQAYPNPVKSLEERVSRFKKQSGYNKISNSYGQSSFYFSYDIKTSPFSETSQIRLECKTACREFLSHRMSTGLDQKNFKPFVMEFSGQQVYPGFIKVIYPKQSHLSHLWQKGKTKPYVVGIDVARQQIAFNYHHDKPSEDITAYIARTIVPENQLRWKTDSTTVVVDYRESITPKVTAYKSGMKIDNQWSTKASISTSLEQNSTEVGTATELLKLRKSEISVLFGK